MLAFAGSRIDYVDGVIAVDGLVVAQAVTGFTRAGDLPLVWSVALFGADYRYFMVYPARAG